ncbi:hopanoid biosynthesis protein HpnM, partial [Azospirillum brasilense]|nr:hopanoid biosynthesis protein HpnM [Azospirillum brasilense]
PYSRQAGGPENRQALAAFGGRSAVRYGDRFDSYDGQRPGVVGERPAPRGMLLVDTDLVRAGKTPVRLSYLLRPEGDRWRILDVLAKGTVSQLATQRSEFQNTLRGGGLAALTRDLNSNADRILGGA